MYFFSTLRMGFKYFILTCNNCWRTCCRTRAWLSLPRPDSVQRISGPQHRPTPRRRVFKLRPGPWASLFARSRCNTYLGIGQLLPIGRQIEDNARAGARQCDTPDKEYYEDDVGKQGREVDHLAGGLDSLAQAEEHNRPGQKKAGSQWQLNAARLLDALGQSQHKIAAKPKFKSKKRLTKGRGSVHGWKD